jgi:ribosomal protein L24
MLRSAFSRDSVSGWFYIEAFMNRALSKLLHSNHQLIRPQEGFGAIDMEEWTMTLDMDDERHPPVGDWVTVRRGLYKGDVGYVSAIENWGQVSLLLVPRLPAPPASGKRKRSTRTCPRLFTKEMRLGVAKDHGITRIYEQIDGSWTMFGRKFQHGLEIRRFHRHSVSSISVSMPSTLFDEFLMAPHPEIMAATFPCPSEWKFSEGERAVVVNLSEKRGIIKAVHPRSVEVDLETGEGVVNVRWPDLRKYIAIGDFAEVISGPLCGEKGWVVEISGNESIRIVERLERQEIRGGPAAVGRDGVPGGVLHNVLTVGICPSFCNQPLISLYQVHELHINWVKVIDSSVSFATQQSTSSSMPADLQKREQVPWIKTEVIVCKVKHPMKGYRAIIKDVLPLQDTPSGLRISAQFTHVDPARPFKTEILDYDDVVEASYVTLFLSVRIVTNFLRVLVSSYTISPGQSVNSSSLF